MKYKLFVSDYDGTLGGMDEIIDVETVKAIKEYTKKGGNFAICTGRPYQSVKRILERNGLSENGIVGCLQGADLRDIKTGEFLHLSWIENSVAAGIVKKIKEKGFSPSLFTSDALYYENYDEYADRYAKLKCIDCIKLDDMVKFINDNPDKSLKIVTVCKQEEIAGLTKEFTEEFGKYTQFNSGASRLFETVNANSTKGKIVEILSKRYGVPYSEILTVGDSTNDIDLIKGEWHGVAVGDGAEELKAVAKEITENFKNKPVKTLLEKYCLKD